MHMFDLAAGHGSRFHCAAQDGSVAVAVAHEAAAERVVARCARASRFLSIVRPTPLRLALCICTTGVGVGGNLCAGCARAGSRWAAGGLHDGVTGAAVRSPVHRRGAARFEEGEEHEELGGEGGAAWSSSASAWLEVGADLSSPRFRVWVCFELFDACASCPGSSEEEVLSTGALRRLVDGQAASPRRRAT